MFYIKRGEKKRKYITIYSLKFWLKKTNKPLAMFGSWVVVVAVDVATGDFVDFKTGPTME